MVGTIFQKSTTPLTIWFQAILIFSSAKSGISASQLARNLEVTYKTAWRILHLIRKAVPQASDKLSGIVEVDGAYFGGIARSAETRSWAHSEKTLMIGAVQRGGGIRTRVVDTLSAKRHQDFIRDHVEPTALLMTDGSPVYTKVPNQRESVIHSKKEYARGKAHINTMESFIGHVKRSARGVHKGVSRQHLQTYLDGFVFHYNYRESDRERFETLLKAVIGV